jgi:hypothetical protein
MDPIVDTKDLTEAERTELEGHMAMIRQWSDPRLLVEFDALAVEQPPLVTLRDTAIVWEVTKRWTKTIRERLAEHQAYDLFTF